MAEEIERLDALEGVVRSLVQVGNIQNDRMARIEAEQERFAAGMNLLRDIQEAQAKQLGGILLAQDRFATALEELRAAQARTDQQMQQTAQQMRETDLRLREVTEKLDAVIHIVDRMQRPEA